MEKASANNNFHYNKSLREKARMLRNHSTKAEILLWDSLLKNRFLGFQFLRQRPVLWYIADFICLELMLVIEVDGDTHLIEEVQQKDKKKHADLEAIGFSVLRFQDWEIFSRRDEVLEDLKAWINTNFPGR
jgi:very-short-patch-repair endonuclease